MTTLDPITAADLDKLMREEVLLPLGADEFTVSTLAARYSISWNRAEHIIESWLAEGKIEFVGKRKYNRQACRAWRVVKGKKSS